MIRLLSKQLFSSQAPLKVLIVGGVAGGASCAARLRRLSEDVHITMFEKGEFISFANCGLPYFIGGVITDRSKLLIQTVEGMGTRFNLDIRNFSEVIKIDRKQKQVQVTNFITKKTYWEKYDKLVLSPGADPLVPPIPGIKNDKIFTLRNIPDTDLIKDFCDQKDPKNAIVIGGGFIGLEMVEMLQHRGIKVTLVEAADHIMGPIDFEMAAIIQQHMKYKGVEMFLNDGVVKFEEVDSKIKVSLASKKIIQAELVILSIGVKPEVTIAKECGLKINRGIVTNAQMLTNDSDIYACGDAIEVENIVSKKMQVVPLAGPANKQGRIVADQIMGRPTLFKGAQGTGIVKVFDLDCASTGLNSAQLKLNNIEFSEVITHNLSHAGYYPGACTQTVKILYSPYDGRLFGAQVVGAHMVDKRIDVLSVCIRHKLSIFDLEELELSYAPPFNTAKDPINFAGFIAANIIKGDLKTIRWDQVAQKQKEGAVFIDVRTKVEYEMGTIKGCVHIDLNTIRDNLDKIPKDKEVVIFCQAGLRGYLAYRILVGKGFTNIVNLAGGFKTYNFAVVEQANVGIFEGEQHKVVDIGEDPLSSNYVFWDKDFKTKFSP